MLNILYKYLLYTWRSYEAQETWDRCVADGGGKRRMNGVRIGLKRGKKEPSDLMTVLNMLSGVDLSKESKKGEDN